MPHAKVTFGGDLGAITNPEHWACSLRLGTSPVDGDWVPTLVNAEEMGIIDALKAWIADPNLAICQLATMRWVKFALLNAQGKYIEDAHIYELPATVKGTASPVSVRPFQISQVVTLHTGARGAQNRGRFYAPLPCFNLGTDGLVPVADIAAATPAHAQLISAINTALTGNRKVIVASSKGHNSVVTGVTVGRVLDTVRSRRRSLKESYAADVVVAP